MAGVLCTMAVYLSDLLCLHPLLAVALVPVHCPGGLPDIILVPHAIAFTCLSGSAFVKSQSTARLSLAWTASAVLLPEDVPASGIVGVLVVLVTYGQNTAINKEPREIKANLQNRRISPQAAVSTVQARRDGAPNVPVSSIHRL